MPSSVHPQDNPYAAKWLEAPDGVIPLTIADMDWPTDPLITEAISRRLAYPLAYPPPYTTDGLGEVLAHYYQSRYGADVRSECFWLLAGTVSAAYLICKEILQPEDEALYLAPSYRWIPSAIEQAGARAVPVPLDATHTPALTNSALKRRITPRTRAIYLCNPHNPTGHVLTRVELQTIADIAREHNLSIISNEIHSRLVLDHHQHHIPISTLSQDAAHRTITLDGPTKSHNLAGLGGVILWSPDVGIVDRFRQRLSHCAAPARALHRAAIEVAYQGDSSWLKETIDKLRHNRDLVTRALSPYGDRITYQPGAATYFAWIDFHDLFGELSAAQALASHGIQLEPGLEFGASDRYARLAFATTPELLKTALARLTAALDLFLTKGPK
ncbi:aminotransferase class I/II-fold pyridoxal phosphate-dependent enzyme [Streptomyces parvulus]|uniref:aminotransferase class I/II-fold pyridoxal phosphate-dependent enzyme n=1 Tax=Streptomyces parvulus TaxID=146923 RepID=UPI00382B8501